jgi:protein TonB
VTSEPPERKILGGALAAALLLHVVALSVPLPDIESAPPEAKPHAIVVDGQLPPPRDLVRRVPIPDPTPDDLGPSGAPEIAPLPPIAGHGGVTLPVLIPESYVEPAYPRVARASRIEGKVNLQAVVLATGAVGEVEVLSCDRPKLGFEEAAVKAVRRWRYEPSLLDGQPIDVRFIVTVEFALDQVP